MKMEQTECSETSAYKIQEPENYPEENIQHVSVYCRGNMITYRLHIVCGSTSESRLIAETGHWHKVQSILLF